MLLRDIMKKLIVYDIPSLEAFRDLYCIIHPIPVYLCSCIYSRVLCELKLSTHPGRIAVIFKFNLPVKHTIIADLPVRQDDQESRTGGYKNSQVRSSSPFPSSNMSFAFSAVLASVVYYLVLTFWPQQARRTQYALTKKSTIPDSQLEAIAETAVKNTPSLRLSECSCRAPSRKRKR
jgi:hypothetical protein